MKKVYHIINSNVGKGSNIGFRCYQILKYSKKYYNFILASDSIHSDKNINVINPFGSQISRALNYLRIITKNLFKHRVADIIIFNICFFVFAKKYFKKNDKCLVHIWEYSPYIIKFLKNKGYTTLLEVPILPSRYTLEIQKKGLSTGGILKKEYLFELESFNLTDFIIAPSYFVKKTLIDLYNIEESKIFVNYFGADLKPKKILSQSSNKRLVFGFAGNISERKGVGMLIKLFKNLPAVDLYLCGRVNMAIPKDLPGNIHITGFVDVNDYWQKFDVYIFPSLMEGSSKSIYEAMASGLPVITTEPAGSIIEHNKDGFIVEVGCLISLNDAVTKFINNPELCNIMGLNAQNKIENGFSWGDYSKRIEGLYDSINF